MVAETAALKLGDIFHVKRGLATGSNGFFILNQDQIERWQIPGQFPKANPPRTPSYYKRCRQGTRRRDTGCFAPALPPRLFGARGADQVEVAGLLRVLKERPRGEDFRGIPCQSPLCLVVLLARTAPPSTVPLYVYGALARWQESLPLHLEPFKRDCAQRIPALMLYPRGPMLHAPCRNIRSCTQKCLRP